MRCNSRLRRAHPSRCEEFPQSATRSHPHAPCRRLTRSSICLLVWPAARTASLPASTRCSTSLWRRRSSTRSKPRRSTAASRPRQCGPRSRRPVPAMSAAREFHGRATRRRAGRGCRRPRRAARAPGRRRRRAPSGALRAGPGPPAPPPPRPASRSTRPGPGRPRSPASWRGPNSAPPPAWDEVTAGCVISLIVLRIESSKGPVLRQGSRTGLLDAICKRFKTPDEVTCLPGVDSHPRLQHHSVTEMHPLALCFR